MSSVRRKNFHEVSRWIGRRYIAGVVANKLALRLRCQLQRTSRGTSQITFSAYILNSGFSSNDDISSKTFLLEYGRGLSKVTSKYGIWYQVRDQESRRVIRLQRNFDCASHLNIFALKKVQHFPSSEQCLYQLKKEGEKVVF